MYVYICVYIYICIYMSAIYVHSGYELLGGSEGFNLPPPPSLFNNLLPVESLMDPPGDQ